MSGIQWQYLFNPSLALESLPFILQGLGYTLWISLVSMTFGTILGFFLALFRLSKFKVLNLLSRIYISFMRGTPMLVFLFILYFGFPFIGIKFNTLNLDNLNSAKKNPKIVPKVMLTTEIHSV